MVRPSLLFAVVVLSACSDEAMGLYHRADAVDAINLDLREETFRWSLMGCDTFAGAHGRVSRESDGSIVLLPQDGESFAWSRAVTAQVARVRLEMSGDTLIERDASGQRWSPGGVCPQCGGSLGPTGQRACDDPKFLDAL